MLKTIPIFLALLLSLMLTGFGATPQDQAAEIGSIKWNRDLEKAKQLAAQSGKPMMLLFQEVPG